MAYTILNTNGTTLTLLPNGEVDDLTTSISLVGKNVNGYGQYINNNFIKLLANFANSTGSPPTNPLKGQVWYDTTVKGLKVYDSAWKKISGATVSDTLPSNLGTGDLWFDTNNSQLRVVLGTSSFVIGPSISSKFGEVGLTVPSTTIKDTNNGALQISLIKNYGNTVGFISQSRTAVNVTDSTLYFSTSTINAVSGVNILGDLQVIGQTKIKYYSMSVDIDILVNGSNNNITVPSQVLNQNAAICDLLEFMYPVKTAKFYREPGLPYLAEARVLCQYSTPTSGYHVRRFYVEAGINTTTNYWKDYITTASGAVLNRVF